MTERPWNPETLAEIERRAHAARAEALAQMFRTFGAWLRSRLGRSPAERAA